MYDRQDMVGRRDKDISQALKSFESIKKMTQTSVKNAKQSSTNSNSSNNDNNSNSNNNNDNSESKNSQEIAIEKERRASAILDEKDQLKLELIDKDTTLKEQQSRV